jgi:hypothetical protein
MTKDAIVQKEETMTKDAIHSKRKLWRRTPCTVIGNDDETHSGDGGNNFQTPSGGGER